MQVENTGRIGDLPNFFALVYIHVTVGFDCQNE